MKTILAALLILVLLIGGGLSALVLLDRTLVKDQVTALASAALGRDVAIGQLDIDLGWPTRVHLENLTISNPEWAEADMLATVPTLDLTVDTAALLRAQVVLEEVVVRQPSVSLERDAEGNVNWAQGAPNETTNGTASSFPNLPIVERLRIDGADITYRDHQTDAPVTARLTSITGSANDRIEVTAAGQLQDEAITLNFSGGPLAALQSQNQPYPMAVELALGATKMRADGQVTALRPPQVDMSIAWQSPNLADVAGLFGIDLPAPLAFSLSGALRREDNSWQLADFDGTLGESDLSGSLLLKAGDEKLVVSGDLAAKKLVVAELLALTPTASDDEDIRLSGHTGPTLERLTLPSAPLHRFDLDVTFTASEIVTAPSLIRDVSTHIDLTAGRLALNPLKLSLADGQVDGEVTWNARTDIPSADAVLSFVKLDLKPFFADTQFVQETGGAFSGDLKIFGDGHNLDEMLSSARGEGWLGMREGSISGLLVEAAGLDVTESLALVIGDDARVRIRCGRVDIEAVEGSLSAKRAVVDTTDSILLARGDADLATRRLDFQIESRPKDFSFLDLTAPVLVSGSFDDPSISIGGLDPLPFLEMGDAEDLDCDRLLAGEISQQQIEEE